MSIKNIFILFFIIILLTACTQNNQNQSETVQQNSENENISESIKQDDESEVISETEQLIQEDETVQTTQAPAPGGTIKVSMRPPKTFNPLINEDHTVDDVLKLVFEPLFILDSQQKLVPNLAQSYSLSENGLNMTVTLKEGIKWEDDTQVTANDLIFSLDTIKSASENSIYKKCIENVASYTKINSSSVVIKYKSVSGTCAYDLCFPLIPAHYYRRALSLDNEKNFRPLGNGLYKFSSYRPVRELILEKSSNFRGNPYIDNIKAIISPDVETDLASFEQAITDIITVDISQWGKFNSNSHINATDFNTNNFEFIGFNFKKTIFNNIYVRQAIAYSIPYNEIIENIYINNAVKSNTPINPLSWLNSEYAEIKEYDYNIAEAKRLISQSEFTTEQLTFSILVNKENNERMETAKIIADSLNQIGMNVTINSQPFEEYRDIIYEDNFDIYIGGIMFYPGNDISTAISYFKFSDLNMNTLINNANSAIGDDNYRTNITEIKRYSINQLPCIGICFKSSIVLTNKRINGEKNPIINNEFNNIENWYIGG